MSVLLLYCVVLSSVLSGCILPAYHSTRLTNFKSHSPVMHADRVAITIDVVAVLNQELYKKMQAMKSQEYFQEIQSLSTLKPNELVVWRFEQMQMTSINLQTLIWPVKQCLPYGVMIFVDYRNNQDNKIDVPYNAFGVELVMGSNAVESINFQYAPKAGEPKKYNQLPKSTNLEKPVKK